ncbi:restriction endonuclease subunit S [Flavobacterium algicola]|uniref:restriction endonuclease subunit S n=1 Tax=Flavobacterium algicola TaxID=556529 RepID=UPI001EFD4E69|nr:restriction endonuclease subunit S [Flavobacterium algicola]MCG9793777.1 restriction endonuclease subunit S [Flavobacterium algicola]
MKDWKKVKLGSLLTESKIVSDNPDPDKRIRVKLNVLGVEKRPKTKDKKGATKYHIRKAGQFIYGKQNLHKGAFGIVPEELDGYESSSDIPAFDVDDSCYPEWIFYFFKKGNSYLQLENLAKGVGSKRIQPKQIFELEIFLPTKEEQERILNEIKTIEDKNYKLIKEVTFREKNLIKLRQAILTDAVKGELTKEWRNNNPNVESAQDLFKKIKIEKEKLIREKKIKKEESFPAINKNDMPFEIPSSWKWYRIGESSINKDGDRIPLSKTERLKRKGIYDYYGAQGVIDYIDDYIFDKSLLLVAEDGGNLLRRNKPVAYMAHGKYWVNNHAHVIDTISEISKLYLEIYINSIDLKPYLSGEPPMQIKLNRGKLNSIPLPLPPLAEQKEIVEKVNYLQANCSKLEEEILISKNESEKLLQSVLYQFLGDENNILVKRNSFENERVLPLREIKYNNKTINMKLVELLKANGRLHAEDLWKMSEHYNKTNESESIDRFYAELKKQIEEEKTIKESSDKGYLELR